MSKLRVFNTPRFEFHVTRGSGEPSSQASFFVTSENQTLDSDVLLGSSGPLEYSLDGSTWSEVTLSTGDTVELTRVYVRAKSDIDGTVSSSNIDVDGILIPYSVSVDTTPSVTTDGAPYTISTRDSSGDEFAVASLTVDTKNLDLVTTAQNKLAVTAQSGFEVALDSGSPLTWSQQIELQVSTPSSSLDLKVRSNRNKTSNSHEICKLTYTLPGSSPVELTSVDFGYHGSTAYVRGNLASLSGVCGETCKPTSVLLDVISSFSNLNFTVSASSGFRFKMTRLAPGGGGIFTSSVPGFRTTQSFTMQSSRAATWRIDVVLDPSVVATSATGTITVASTSVAGGFETIIVPIPASTNARATAIPVCKWLNLVTPADAGTVFLSAGLYRQDNSQVAPFLLSQETFVVKYAGSAFYLDPELESPEGFNVAYAPITYDNLFSDPPTTPGKYEIIVSWESFVDAASQIEYGGGEIKLPYTILPESNTSPVFYGIQDFVQYTAQNRYIHGLAYDPTPVARSISAAQPLSSEGLSLIFEGTTENGVSYRSTTPPDYPGTYQQLYFYANVDVVFQPSPNVGGIVQTPVAHNLQNGDVLTLVSAPPDSDGLFSDPIEDHIVEVIDATTFKLKLGLKYFRCPIIGPYQFLSPSNQTIDCYPVYNPSTVVDPEIGVVNEYQRVFRIERRAVIITPQSADRQFTTDDPEPRQMQINVLASDSSGISLEETIYEYSDRDTGELSRNANDWNDRKYIARSFYSTAGDPSVINKYNIPAGETYDGAQIFRKHYYVTWANDPVGKEYDKSDWQDLDETEYVVEVYGGEDPGDYGLSFEVSLTAFPRKDSAGNDVPSIDVGDYIGYYEISTSGENQDNLILYPYVGQVSEISITPKSLTTPELYFSKKYDGATRILVNRADSILTGVLIGDDVYIQYVEATLPDATSNPVADAKLAGPHSQNYVVSTQDIYSEITRRDQVVNLSARKVYNGQDNVNIPLTVTYSGTVDPLQYEPVCFSITSPAYDSGDAGAGKTSSDVLEFLGLNPENYTFNFNYNNTSSTFQASGTSVYGVNPVEGVIDQAVLSVDPQSLTGSKEYDGSVDAHDSVNFSFLNVQGEDELDETDIRYTATLNNANRGLRSFSLVVTGMSSSSTYFGNYLISGTFSGACTVTPKPVNSALARTWLLFSGKTATTGQLTHTYNKANPSIIFNILENPSGTTVYETSVAREIGEDEFAVVPEFSNAGEYFLRLSFTGWSNQNSFSNYKPDPTENAEYVEIPFTVLKKKIIVHTVSVADTTYLSPNWSSPVVAFDTSGVLSGDVHGVTATGTYVSNSGVYVPSSTVNLLFSTTNENYEIDTANSTSSVTGKVSPKTVTVGSAITQSSTEKVYNGTQQAVLVFDGVTPGQPPSLAGIAVPDQAFVSISAQSLTETFYASRNAGIRDISCFYQLTGARALNYVLGLTVYPGTILPKTISFEGMYGVSKVFDGNEVCSLSPDNFSYTGLVAQDVAEYAGTPIGNLSAYYTNFEAGADKEVRLVGLQPPTPNYVLQDSEQGWFVLPDYNSTPYEIFKRPFILKAKGISKYFGEILVTPLANLPETEFEVIGLVEENFLNAIDPLTGKHFGDKLLKATRVVNEGAARDDSTGIYVGVVYASNPVLERGDLDNYELLTGAQNPSYRAPLVVIDASFKELTLAIKEAIWAKECSAFGCRELNWFDIITTPNRKITIVDFSNADPQHDTGDYVKIEQSLAEPEVLVTE